MPDLWQHVVATTGSTVQVGPSAVTKATQYAISGQVTADNNQTVLASYSFNFPNCLSSLTAAQVDTLMQMIARYLITCETGL